MSTDLCRLTSIILKIEAPLAAADVRKPDRESGPRTCWVESFALRIGLDDNGDGSVREPLRCHRAGLVDGTE